ncbi:MAG: hypothetical protein ILA17_06130 [Ruminococcus sp.]|nr:hypothetical protein [Ruminococcus sp.]
MNSDLNTKQILDEAMVNGVADTLSRLGKYLERENSRIFDDSPSMSEYVRTIERKKRRSREKGRRR